MRKIHLVVFLTITLMLSFFPKYSQAHSMNDTINLQSGSAVLMDAKTGTVVYNKNAENQMYPASLTKVATAILAIEEGNLNETVTVSENARNVEGTRVYLEEGEKVTLKKLVQGLLINSGNDAAISIAEHLNGDVEGFAERMNEFFKTKVGVENTSFTNPHGLFHENHVTNAIDLALITKYSLQNDTFREIFGTKEMKWDGQGWKTTIYNHNQLLWRYEGATGGKTGYVSKSGNTLITTAERNGTEFIAVVLKSPSKEVAYEDTIKLLDYGYEFFETKIIPEDTEYSNENGELFYTTKDMYYTIEKDKDITQEINDLKQLVIKDDENNILLQEKIKMKTEDQEKVAKVQTEPSSQEEPKPKSNNILWIVPFIIVTTLASITFFKNYKNNKTTPPM